MAHIIARIRGIWGSDYNIPKAVCFLLKGDHNHSKNDSCCSDRSGNTNNTHCKSRNHSTRLFAFVQDVVVLCKELFLCGFRIRVFRVSGCGKLCVTSSLPQPQALHLS